MSKRTIPGIPEPAVSLPMQRSRAARVIAANAHDAEDLAYLLDVLGLAACEARDPGSAPDDLEQIRRAKSARRGDRKLRVTELASLLSNVDTPRT
ncbi:MAG: hypothetical protein GEU86_18540 [Actinophytocola sp.]|nr:hypothetical protein [Actinophytocola sp.]